MMLDFTNGQWVNQPKKYSITSDLVSMTTEPRTDFWQRSYYGFRNDNAPALQIEYGDNFTFSAKVSFSYKAQFDQCGLVIYLDSDNWFKVSIEYENEILSRLGSVVTNLGYSDWATTDITLPKFIWYRLSRRGPDFRVESSLDGENFQQLRIFHLHKLGETTEAMGKCDPPQAAQHSIQVGIYACSPSNSSFTAVFSDMRLEPCLWLAHVG